MADNYVLKDLVYSARYDQAAYISKKLKEDAVGGIYRIWLIKDCQYAIQPFFELGDLRRLQTELGLNIVTRKMFEFDEEGNEPLQNEISKALANARKRKKE